MSCPNVPFDLTDLNNLNIDLAAGIDFGNVATPAAANTTNVPSDFAHLNFEPQPYVDNMDVDITEMQQDFAAFYHTLQQNPDDSDPDGHLVQTNTAGIIDQCTTNGSLNTQRSELQFAAQPAARILAPLQTPQKEMSDLGTCSSTSSSSSHSERSASLSPPSLGGSPASMASTMSFSENLKSTIAAQNRGQSLSQEVRSSFIKGIFADYDGSSIGSHLQTGNGDNGYTANPSSTIGDDSTNIPDNPQISFNDEEFVTYSAAGSQSQGHNHQEDPRHMDFTLYDAGFVSQSNGPSLQAI
ncbi:hypothetical protein KEM54_006792 [Ascosphaera aggregata]|nr:hypothetical protein KEM54_006792 [Ascosphaera aggregata]